MSLWPIRASAERPRHLVDCLICHECMGIWWTTWSTMNPQGRLRRLQRELFKDEGNMSTPTHQQGVITPRQLPSNTETIQRKSGRKAEDLGASYVDDCVFYRGYF